MDPVLQGAPDFPAEILVVAGRAYVFGLRWTSATSRATLETEAKAAATAEGANYIVLHRTYNQFGLAKLANSPSGAAAWFHRPRSGIASVALSAGTATLAAFPLDDDRWLVLAIDRKGFLPDGDMIVATAERAKARIETLIAQSPTSWRRKFLPAEWAIADAKTVDPRSLLIRNGAPRLVPLWFLANRLRIRAAVGLVTGMVTALGIAAMHFIGARPPEPVVTFQAPKPVAAIWTPAAFAIDSCLSALRSAQRYNAVPGWIPAKYSCLGGDSVAIDFTRMPSGQIAMIRMLLPQAHVSDDGRAAVLAIPLSTLPRVSAAALFAPPERYRVIGLDVSQRLDGSFALDAPKKLLPGEAATAQPNQAWRLFSWSYQTRAPAIVWASAIARLGAISIESIVFTPTDNRWQLTGSLYASN